MNVALHFHFQFIFIWSIFSWGILFNSTLSTVPIIFFLWSGQGDVFGDDFNLNPEAAVQKATGNVRALTYCDLHQISRDDLLQVLGKYPKFWEIFNREFEVTYNLTSEHETVRYYNNIVIRLAPSKSGLRLDQTT